MKTIIKLEKEILEITRSLLGNVTKKDIKNLIKSLEGLDYD